METHIAPTPATAFFDDPRLLAPRQVEKIDRADGAFILRSPEPLAPYARCVGEWLEAWAAQTPDAIAFAEARPEGGWRWTAARRRFRQPHPRVRPGRGRDDPCSIACPGL